MNNQHKLIKGYRDLSQDEINMMNRIKVLASDVGVLVDDLLNQHNIDARWVAIAKTDLQKGFMSLTRSVAQPDSF